MDIQKRSIIPLKLNKNRAQSELVAYLPPFQFRFQITGPISSRGRRTILTLVFKKLRELFGEMRDAEIYHERRSLLYGMFPLRPISFRETPVLDTPNGRVGYALRLRRHLNKLTLREVSELSGVNIGHLSDLERGKHRPLRETVQRIEIALARYEEEGIIILSEGRTQLPKNFRKSRRAAKRCKGGVPRGWVELFEAQQALASKIDSDP